MMKMRVLFLTVLSFGLGGCATTTPTTLSNPLLAWDTRVVHDGPCAATQAAVPPPGDIRARGVVVDPSPVGPLNQFASQQLAKQGFTATSKNPYHLRFDGLASISGNDAGLQTYTLANLAGSPVMPPLVLATRPSSNKVTVGDVIANNQGGFVGPPNHISFDPTSLAVGLGVSAAVQGAFAATGLKGKLDNAFTGDDQYGKYAPYWQVVSLRMTLLDGARPVWHVHVKGVAYQGRPALTDGFESALEVGIGSLQ